MSKFGIIEKLSEYDDYLNNKTYKFTEATSKIANQFISFIISDLHPHICFEILSSYIINDLSPSTYINKSHLLDAFSRMDVNINEDDIENLFVKYGFFNQEIDINSYPLPIWIICSMHQNSLVPLNTAVCYLKKENQYLEPNDLIFYKMFLLKNRQYKWFQSIFINNEELNKKQLNLYFKYNKEILTNTKKLEYYNLLSYLHEKDVFIRYLENITDSISALQEGFSDDLYDKLYPLFYLIYLPNINVRNKIVDPFLHDLITNGTEDQYFIKAIECYLSYYNDLLLYSHYIIRAHCSKYGNSIMNDALAGNVYSSIYSNIFSDESNIGFGFDYDIGVIVFNKILAFNEKISRERVKWLSQPLFEEKLEKIIDIMVEHFDDYCDKYITNVIKSLKVDEQYEDEYFKKSEKAKVNFIYKCNGEKLIKDTIIKEVTNASDIPEGILSYIITGK